MRRLINRLRRAIGAWEREEEREWWVERWAAWLVRVNYPYDWTAWEEVGADGEGARPILPPAEVLDELAAQWWAKEGSVSGDTVMDYRETIRLEAGG